MSPPHKVLIVSYHFPPDSRVGAVRPAKFAKYLSRFGWQPYVLTIGLNYIPSPDEDRLRDVRDVPTVRTAVWPTVTDAFARLRRRLLATGGRRAAAATSSDRQPLAGEPPASHVAERAGRAADWSVRVKRLLYALFEFPDSEVGWVVPAVWRGYRLMKREGIRVVMVTSPPRSSVLIGVALARLTGARLITDLRDPWFSWGDDTHRGRLGRSDRVRAWLERRIMERSDAVVTTTDRYTASLRQHYPLIDARRFHTITNGYDQDDVDDVASVAPDQRFTLSYLGTFYWTRTPAPLLAALSQLVAAGAIPRDVVRVNFIGTVKIADGVPVRDLVRSYGLEGIVQMRGVVPYRRSLTEMKKSSVLVLIAADAQSYGIPAKTFEYIAVGRPILCLGDKGATADLIRRTNSGLVVNPSNVADITHAIETLYANWQSGTTDRPDADITMFERSRLTRELANVLS